MNWPRPHTGGTKLLYTSILCNQNACVLYLYRYVQTCVQNFAGVTVGSVNSFQLDGCSKIIICIDKIAIEFDIISSPVLF